MAAQERCRTWSEHLLRSLYLQPSMTAPCHGRVPDACLRQGPSSPIGIGWHTVRWAPCDPMCYCTVQPQPSRHSSDIPLPLPPPSPAGKFDLALCSAGSARSLPADSFIISMISAAERRRPQGSRERGEGQEGEEVERWGGYGYIAIPQPKASVEHDMKARKSMPAREGMPARKCLGLG